MEIVPVPAAALAGRQEHAIARYGVMHRGRLNREHVVQAERAVAQIDEIPEEAAAAPARQLRSREGADLDV